MMLTRLRRFQCRRKTGRWWWKTSSL